MTKEQAIFYLKRIQKDYLTELDHVALAKQGVSYEARQSLQKHVDKDKVLSEAIDMAIEALEK